MKLIYIEATKEELASNKTVGDALCDAIGDFMGALVRTKPVLSKTVLFDEGDGDE